MPFITLGSAAQLQLQYPTSGSTSWSSTLQTQTFLKISTHDHSASGNGAQLGTGSLLADAVTGAKLLLDNDEYLRGRNNADSANIDTIKVNTSDKIAFGADVANFNIINNTYLTGRNQADSANIDIVKIDGGDQLEFGTQVSALNLKTATYLTGRNAANSANVNIAKIDAQDRVDLLDGSIVLKGSATLADNTAAATIVPNAPTASTDEALFIYYKLVRGTSVQFGQLIVDEDNSGLIEETYGDDCGVTFTEDAGALDYVTTSTGTAVTMTYTIIKL